MKMKTIIAAALSLVMLGTAGCDMPAFRAYTLTASALTASGTCGENCTWEYDSDHEILTISGTGDMDSYISTSPPWHEVFGSVVIKNGVTSIGDGAFYGCDGLTSITIPDSVINIGYGAFGYCTGLRSITIPGNVTSISEKAFYLSSGLRSITIPNSVTCIGDRAFYGCFELTSFTIPDSVTSIGDAAFMYCTSLTCITIPDGVISISEHAFDGCSELTSITIPSSVKSIAQETFAYCNMLTSITIPNGMKSIGYKAFYNCNNLESITIPDSIINIDYTAFNNCHNIKISGHSESYAEKYAERVGIPFKSLGVSPSRDLNSDGAFSVADVVLFAQFLNEDTALTDIQAASIMCAKPDLDGDGILSLLDMRAFLSELETE